MKYRPEIDGLRAIAVIPIIFFHLNFKIFSGGYVGVDIFFVISGFLISTIILEEIGNKNFSLVNFYERRVRRILPALYLMLITSILFSWILLQPNEFIEFHKSLFSALTFSSNIYFLRHDNYFVANSSLKPLLHTWSLAVEEQFYIFFPLFLLLIKKLNRRLIFYILLIITITSLILCQLASFYFKTSNYYLLPTRFWELSLGAIISFKFNDFKNLSNSKKNEVFGFIGLAMIFISIFFFDDFTPYPSIFTLLPVCGTALIIIFVSKDEKVGFFLSNKLLRTIGLLSYSAYLFHQPIISFTKIYLDRDMTFLYKIFILLIIFMISYLSYKFVELTFINRKIFSRKKIFYTSIFISIVLLLYSIFVFRSMDFPLEKDLAKRLSSSSVIVIASAEIDERKFTKYRIDYSTLNPDVLVIGSSRLMQVSSSSIEDNVFNLSVSGASVEDLITFSVLALQKFTPKRIYLSADPWLFNENSGQNRWETIKDDYEEALKIITMPNVAKANFHKTNKINNNFAFNLYKKVNINYSQSYITNINSGLYDKMQQDGKRIYNSTFENLSLNEIRSGFKNTISYSMANYKFSQKYFHYYEKLIDFLNYRKIEIFLVLPPYHPELYKIISNEKYKFITTENIFYKIAKDKSVSIIGSYNPDKCNCIAIDFYDGMHPRSDCINNILLNNSNLKF